MVASPQGVFLCPALVAGSGILLGWTACLPLSYSCRSRTSSTLRHSVRQSLRIRLSLANYLFISENFTRSAAASKVFCISSNVTASFPALLNGCIKALPYAKQIFNQIVCYPCALKTYQTLSHFYMAGASIAFFERNLL